MIAENIDEIRSFGKEINVDNVKKNIIYVSDLRRGIKITNKRHDNIADAIESRVRYSQYCSQNEWPEGWFCPPKASNKFTRYALPLPLQRVNDFFLFLQKKYDPNKSFYTRRKTFCAFLKGHVITTCTTDLRMFMASVSRNGGFLNILSDVKLFCGKS